MDRFERPNSVHEVHDALKSLYGFPQYPAPAPSRGPGSKTSPRVVIRLKNSSSTEDLDALLRIMSQSQDENDVPIHIEATGCRFGVVQETQKGDGISSPQRDDDDAAVMLAITQKTLDLWQAGINASQNTNPYSLDRFQSEIDSYRRFASQFGPHLKKFLLDEAICEQSTVLAHRHMNEQNFDTALRHIDTVLQIRPDHPRGLLLRDTCIRRRQYER